MTASGEHDNAGAHSKNNSDKQDDRAAAPNQRRQPPRSDGFDQDNASKGHEQPRYDLFDDAPTQQSNEQYYRDDLVRVRKKHKKKHKGLKITLVVVIVLVALIGVGGLSLYHSARTLQSQANTAMSGINNVQTALTSGNYSSAQTAAKSTQDAAKNMTKELSSPIWTIASVIPVYGSDVKGVRTMASALEDVSTNALIPLTDALSANPLSNIVSSDGSINVNAVSSLLSSLDTAAPAMQRCADSFGSISSMHIKQLEDVLTKAQDKISGINDGIQQANAFSPLISTMLGGSGERTYIIIAQNSTEIRATGGFPGSVGTLTVNNGAMTLGSFGTVSDYMEQIITDPWDAGYDPNFPTVAQFWQTACEAKMGIHTDGIISITPAIVQDILAITGPITLSDGSELDGTNAARVLEHDIYWKYLSADNFSEANNKTADALFAEAAKLTFQQIFSDLSSSKLMKLASVFSNSMGDRVLMFWLSDTTEQSQIASANCSGALNSDPTKPEAGIFMTDWCAGKLGWYLNRDISSSVEKQNSDGSITYKIQVKLTNTMTQAEASQAGTYIGGENTAGQSTTGEMLIDLSLYAPAGGSISSITASDSSSFRDETENNLPYKIANVGLVPGASATFTYTVTTSTSQSSPLSIASTPTLQNYR